MPTTVDRLTVNFAGEKALAECAAFRRLVGERSINRVLRELVREWVAKQGKPNGKP